jgi:sensor histidine kinase YesM
MKIIAQDIKPFSFSKKEWIIAVLILPPFSFLLNYVLFGVQYFSSFIFFSITTFVILAVITLVYISCSIVAVMLRNRFPEYSQTFKRVSIGVSIYIAIMAAGLTIIFWGCDFVGFMGYEISFVTYTWALIVSAFCTIMGASLNEGASLFERWREVVNETEQLKKENLQSQFEVLKGQVNPHFLFNSLNSLSSLINDDPQKAEKFLDEMSKVYHYLLRTNEDGLTTLRAEMDFINSYSHLLKTRFGFGLDIKITIEDRFLNFLLPPLTLQLLVENAVKHNMILKDSPLHIYIFTTNSRKLIVSNNQQRKNHIVASNKVGLCNIAKKYRLLNQEEINVRDDGKEFAVVVPLIHPLKEAIN